MDSAQHVKVRIPSNNLLCFIENHNMSDPQIRDVRFPTGEKIKGFKGKIKVNPKNYDIEHQYFLDDQQCPKVILNSHQAKNFAAYALIKKDLKFVLKAFKYAISIAKDEVEVDSENDTFHCRTEIDSEADILKAFYISAVATYGKCFTKADGRRVKLEYKELFNDNEKDLKERHLNLMEQRHQYIAHGGKTKYEKVNPILVLHPDRDGNHPPTLMTESFHIDGFGKADFEKFLTLVETVDNKLNEILDKKSKALYQKEVAPQENDFWYRQIKT